MWCPPALPALLLLPLLGLDVASACTTLAVGRLASTDGSTMLSHSDDGETKADPRLCFVPAADHAPGSQRPIFWDTEGFPRHVGDDRGSCYLPQPGQAPYTPIGYIPQVERTFSYYEATYGIMNEKGLAIGESTCSAVFGTSAVGHGGKALLSVDTLSQIAMERASTAREAVALMGMLAEKYGFYGAGSFEGSAESLMVGDPAEVFIFHILPDPTGTSAIWAAQRVPDNHVAVVANMFVLREIDFGDTQNFLFSESVRSVAEAKGWWKRGEALDFTKVYSDGEYASKFYSGRRVWGAFLKFGVDLPDDYEDLRFDAVYPVTAEPPNPVGVRDLFSIHRYYYQGTKYDMTKGLAAGPWGDPDRWATSSKAVSGSWERSIGLYRTTTAHVVQAKSSGQGSVMWFGPHSAATTCFVPLSQPSSSVPAPYAVGSSGAYNRDSAYWAHRAVFNAAKIKYSYAMTDVRALQDQMEQAGALLVAQLDARKVTQAELNAAYAKHATAVVEAFWKLAPTILQKYSDGWLEDSGSPGYPDWWLNAVGYKNGPPPPPTEPTVALPRSSAGRGGKCSDADVGRCVRRCPQAEGFAVCAAACARPCEEGHPLAGEPQSELVV